MQQNNGSHSDLDLRIAYTQNLEFYVLGNKSVSQRIETVDFYNLGGAVFYVILEKKDEGGN